MTGPPENLPAVALTAEQVDSLVAEADRRARDQVCAELTAHFADRYRAAVARELASPAREPRVPDARDAGGATRAGGPRERAARPPVRAAGPPERAAGPPERSGRRQERNDEHHEDTAWYAYAVVPRRGSSGAGLSPDDLHDLVGVEGRPVELVAVDGVAIAGATVPLAGFRSTSDEPDLSAGGWLQDALRTHERVVERLCAHATALPFRFGVLYPSRDHAQAILQVHAAQLSAELDRLAGLVEWGVRVRATEPPETEPPETEPPATEPPATVPAAEADAASAADATETATTVPMETVRTGTSSDPEPQAPTGTAWMRQRRDAAAAREESRQLRAGVGRSVDEALTPYTQDVVVRSPARPDPAAEVVFDAVYLVPRSSEGERAFHEAVESLRTRHAGAGVRFDLTGPWPPYHFVRLPADLADATATTGEPTAPAASLARPRGPASERTRSREEVSS